MQTSALSYRARGLFVAVKRYQFKSDVDYFQQLLSSEQFKLISVKFQFYLKDCRDPYSTHMLRHGLLHCFVQLLWDAIIAPQNASRWAISFSFRGHRHTPTAQARRP